MCPTLCFTRRLTLAFSLVAQQSRISPQCMRCRLNPWVRKIPWRRVWQPTPLFLPGESHGQRSLVGYSPWSQRVRHDWFHLLHFWELNVKGYGCRHPDAPPLIEQWRGKVSHVFHGLARWSYVGIIWKDCPRRLSAKLHLSKKKLEYTTGCRNWGGFLTGQPRRKLVGCWKAAVGALWGSYVSTKN